MNFSVFHLSLELAKLNPIYLHSFFAHIHSTLWGVYSSNTSTRDDEIIENVSSRRRAGMESTSDTISDFW